MLQVNHFLSPRPYRAALTEDTADFTMHSQTKQQQLPTRGSCQDRRGPTWWHQLPELALGIGPVCQQSCCLLAACLGCLLLDQALELSLSCGGDHPLDGNNLCVDLQRV